jgi:hypothetical protein
MKDEEQSEGRYRVQSRSWHSAGVDRQVLTLRSDDETSLTRRVIDPIIVENPNDARATVKIELRHQRRGKADAPWDDRQALSLATLRAGEEVRLALSSAETLRLYEHLTKLYEIGKGGVRLGESYVTVFDKDDVAVISGEAKAIVESLIDAHGQDIFRIIDEIRPDLLTAAALARRYEEWSEALGAFERHVADEDWDEPQWQAFFEGNAWIFGHGLDYRFLVTEQAQPNYGGTSVTGRGGEKGDLLMASEANIRFAVLVEIKRPDTQLLSKKQYRNGAWLIGEELAGGTAQLQANCDRWAKEGSRLDANRDWAEERNVATVQPKGILLIGNLGQLEVDSAAESTTRRETFERFRRGLWNPEVLTYDELLERARFLVNQAKPSATADVEDEALPHWLR